MNLFKSGLILLLVLFISASCIRQKLTPGTVSQLPNNGSDYVVLMHGLWNSSNRMEDFEEYFIGKKFQVLNLDYPSTEYPIEELDRQFIKPVIDAIPLQPGQKIHFITHSLGGIVLRQTLTRSYIPQLGQVVMISPPNHGSEWADLLTERPSAQKLAGPAAMQLRTKSNNFFHQLGPVNYNLGIIAGNESYTDGTDKVLPGVDDGMVSVESMKLENMKDFIVLNEHHRGLTENEEAMKQAEHFIKNVSFQR